MSYKIAIYTQHHTQAGRWAQDWDADTDAESDHYVVYEGSREELLAHAFGAAASWHSAAADERAAGAGAGDDVVGRRTPDGPICAACEE